MRRFKQIAVDSINLFALDEDGQIWFIPYKEVNKQSGEWVPLEPPSETPEVEGK